MVPRQYGDLMAVRKCPKHENCYLVDWRPEGRNGRRPQRHFPGTEAGAHAFHMEMVRVSRREPVPTINPKVFQLLPDWKAQYRNDHAASTVKDLETALVHLVNYFGTMYLAEISGLIIEQFKARQLELKLSKRTINKHLSYFSGFLRWCADHHYCEPVKVRLFPAKQTKAPKPRTLHPNEVTAMLRFIEQEYRAIFLLYNDAGLRRSEALGDETYFGLRAEDIDLQFNCIYVRGKGNKERIVPILTSRLRQALEERLKNVKSGHLFLNPKNKNKPYQGIRKALKRAAAAAGIDKRVYHHLLRHNFGTHAIVAGLGLRQVQYIMGHSTSHVTEGYTHVANYLDNEAAKFSLFTEGKPATEKKKAKSTADVSKKRKPATAKAAQTRPKI